MLYKRGLAGAGDSRKVHDRRLTSLHAFECVPQLIGLFDPSEERIRVLVRTEVGLVGRRIGLRVILALMRSVRIEDRQNISSIRALLRIAS